MAFPWPDILVSSTESPPHLRNAAKSGGPGLEGGEQRAFSPGSIKWEIRYDNVKVTTRAQTLAWISTVDRLRAGEEVIATIPNRWRADHFFSPDSAAASAGAYAAGAVEMDIAATGITLAPGVMFSFENRLYRISRIVAEVSSLSLVDIILSDEREWSDSAAWVEDGSGGPLYTVRILPPLRQPVADNAALNFQTLTCLCVIDDMASGDLTLDLGRTGSPSLALREA